jgi:hypothetical protein
MLKECTALGVCNANCYDNIDNHMVNDTVDSNTHSIEISDVLFPICAEVKLKSSVMLMLYCLKFPANSGCTLTV